MGSTRFSRDDRRLVVRLDDELAFTTDDWEFRRRKLTEAERARLLEGSDEGLLAGLVTRAVAALDPAPPGTAEINRLVVDLPDSLAWAPWERLLARLAAGRTMVRQVASRPSYAQQPIVVPLRILHVTTGPAKVASWLDGIIGHARQDFPDVAAVQVTSLPPAAVPTALQALRWPVADVIHVDSPLVPVTDDRLQWAEAFTRLEHLVRLAQCRLLILEPVGPFAAGPLRSIADSLARRGGPAVLVPQPSDPNLSAFYYALVHDFPVDAAVNALAAPWLDPPCLYAGQGREEGLRVSLAADAIAREPTLISTAAPGSAVAADLDELTHQWDSYHFDFSERLGLYPMTEWFQRLRASYERDVRPAPSVMAPTRYVNAALYQGDEVVPSGPRTPLQVGARYDLRVDVGPLEVSSAAALAEPLVFEQQLWEEADEGLWLDVGVTGIGWEVLDDAVQPLFVSKVGPTTPCWFGVQPTERGIPVLRYTLFHNGHVIQSFRLAAVVGHSDDATDSKLAALLDLPTGEVAGRTWRSRLEFSTVATVEQARQRPPRSLAIVANEIDGRAVLTFKTGGDFEVNAQNDVDDYVRKARQALEALTFNPVNRNYLFGQADDPNGGTEEWFTTEILPRLAKLGADLYEKLIPMRVRLTLPPLGGAPDTIQVAQILREKVIPWSLVYQGKYDPKQTEDEGKPVGHAVCTALLDPDNPAAFSLACGQHDRCLLHPANVDARRERGEPRLIDRTVACPGRFWGFRHRIEVPPRQVPPDGRTISSVNAITGNQQGGAVLAFSAELPMSEQHRQELRAAVSARRARALYEPDRRDAIVTALGRDDLDIVYVFCTANGGEQGPLPPELLFQDPGDDSTKPQLVALSPAALEDVIWTRHPLVVLNGCGTAAFSPRAVSEFIRAFVDDREASAVLGTEAAVADVMASEFGYRFLLAFLNGTTAGDALLQARRALLGRFNPLGLGYTLYGQSELHLA
jgi:hypothetical protein